MKVYKLYFIWLVIALPVLGNSRNRSDLRQGSGRPFNSWQAYSQGGTVELEQSYDFSISGQTHQISFVVPLPQSVPDRQNILSIGYNPKPSRIFESGGSRYAEFVFDEPEEQVKVKIRIRAELLRYDLFTAMKSRKNASPEADGLEDFLRQERFIEKEDDQIQEIADGIEGRTQVDVVHKIYNYVLDHMEYTTPSRRSRGAVMALKWGQGDCTEYADLFVALCRAKDLPARVVTGYTVRFDSKSPKHNWAEVYLQEYGWVPFDPSAGDIEHPIIRGRAFSRMRPVYLYLSHNRNDEILGGHSFGAYVFWGDKPRFQESIDFYLLSSLTRRGN